MSLNFVEDLIYLMNQKMQYLILLVLLYNFTGLFFLIYLIYLHQISLLW